MLPIRFSQHEHRILTGQKPYFKRVLPLFSKPQLEDLESVLELEKAKAADIIPSRRSIARSRKDCSD